MRMLVQAGCQSGQQPLELKESLTLVSTEESQSEGTGSLLRILLSSPGTHTHASGLHRFLCLDLSPKWLPSRAAFLLFLDLSSNISSFERPSLCPVLLFSNHICLSKSYFQNCLLALSPQPEYKLHEPRASECLASSYVLSTQKSTLALSEAAQKKSVTNQIHLNQSSSHKKKPKV